MKEAILAVNAASIAILLFFTALLLATSRYHGARGWACYRGLSYRNHRLPYACLWKYF